MNIILLGPPGAGKGTQAKRLQQTINVPHIASGDLFRAIRKQDSPLARDVAGYMDRGEYVPDNLTIELVLNRLHEPDAKRGFVLDGFPRTLPQAGALDEQLARDGKAVDRVLFITSPVEVLVTRLTGRVICPNCGAIYNAETKPPRLEMICDVCNHHLTRRTDEEVNVIRTRLDTYIRQTIPLVEYYRECNVLTEIDGSQDIDQVELEVDEALGVFGGKR